MPTKSFPKSIQAAAQTALPEWQFLEAESNANLQTFEKMKGAASSGLGQRIDFQNGWRILFRQFLD